MVAVEAGVLPHEKKRVTLICTIKNIIPEKNITLLWKSGKKNFRYRFRSAYCSTRYKTAWEQAAATLYVFLWYSNLITSSCVENENK